LLCSNPYQTADGELFGCGQCLHCRINRRREWTLRIMLESYCHLENSFLTLTYENKPLCGSVCPSHLKNFLKRVRSYFDHKIRFYAVAEYGPKDLRPHYHLALFGVPPCKYLDGPHNLPHNMTRNKTPQQITCQCDNCQTLYKLWGKGITYNARLEKDSAQYIASYVIDKLDKKSCALLGLNKEFTRMSLKPGIGLGFNGEGLEFLKKFLESDHGELYLKNNGDVPHSVHISGTDWPLSNYLRRKLRVMLGREETTPLHMLELVSEDRLNELNEWRKNNPSEVSFTRNVKIDSQNMLKQKRRNRESKYKLYSKRKLKL
jgi:hypothetical protein